MPSARRIGQVRSRLVSCIFHAMLISGGLLMDSQSQRNMRYVIKQEELPALYPTHGHSPQFWEYLGRTVATFGFLEEVLGKAIFALQATRRYDSDEELRAAYEGWERHLQRALTDQIFNLSEVYLKAFRDNDDPSISGIDELVSRIKEAGKIRNVLCHGSWRLPDEAGRSLPYFFNKQCEKFETLIDIDFLRNVQRCVTEYSCAVIDSITFRGLQFPGSKGPGVEVWPRT
jgi:hypothetical protein